jgi:hypothetical protein
MSLKCPARVTRAPAERLPSRCCFSYGLGRSLAWGFARCLCSLTSLFHHRSGLSDLSKHRSDGWTYRNSQSLSDPRSRDQGLLGSLRRTEWSGTNELKVIGISVGQSVSTGAISSRASGTETNCTTGEGKSGGAVESSATGTGAGQKSAGNSGSGS